MAKPTIEQGSTASILRKARVAAAVGLLLLSPASTKQIRGASANCSPRQAEVSTPADANLFMPAAAIPKVAPHGQVSPSHKLVWGGTGFTVYYELPMSVPTDLETYLKKRVAVANQLLLPKNKIATFDVFAGVGGFGDKEIDGNPGESGTIDLLLPHRPIRWGEMGQIVDHEVEHVVQTQNVDHDYNMEGDYIGHGTANPDFVRAFSSLQQNYTEAGATLIAQMLKPITPVQQQEIDNIHAFDADVAGSWFQVIDESTYDPYVTPTVGHPYSNYQEAFASGSHVMQRYPHGLECSIMSLPQAGQAPIKLLLRSIIDIDLEQSNGPATVPAMFDPNLISLINQ